MGCAIGTVEERFNGEGTWNREARRVTLLAAELGSVLDEETLVLCDVRDLMALRLCLQRALAREARRPWAILRPGSADSGSVASRRACVTAAVGAFWSAVKAKLAHAVGYSSTR